METTTKKRDVYQIATDRILQYLEKGIIPWRKAWTEAGLPQNMVTKRPYRNINVMLLTSLGNAENYFLTSNQIKELKALIKEGEKGCPVIYWSSKEDVDKGTEEPKKIWSLQYYTVFNLAQTEGIPNEAIPPVMREVSPVISAEEIVAGMEKKPQIRHKEKMAYYNPINDFINMPKIDELDDYYAMLFRQLVHSTGHRSRLHRRDLLETVELGGNAFSFEELVTDIGASYLQALTGIGPKPTENEAELAKEWAKKLERDSKLIVRASWAAQKATDLILNMVKVEEPEEVATV